MQALPSISFVIWESHNSKIIIKNFSFDNFNTSKDSNATGAADGKKLLFQINSTSRAITSDHGNFFATSSFELFWDRKGVYEIMYITSLPYGSRKHAEDDTFILNIITIKYQKLIDICNFLFRKRISFSRENWTFHKQLFL